MKEIGIDDRISAAKLFIERQGADSAASLIAHQSIALEGLTKNNSALGEAYRAALQSAETPASAPAMAGPPTGDCAAALRLLHEYWHAGPLPITIGGFEAWLQERLTAGAIK